MATEITTFVGASSSKPAISITALTTATTTSTLQTTPTKPEDARITSLQIMKVKILPQLQNSSTTSHAPSLSLHNNRTTAVAVHAAEFSNTVQSKAKTSRVYELGVELDLEDNYGSAAFEDEEAKIVVTSVTAATSSAITREPETFADDVSITKSKKIEPNYQSSAIESSQSQSVSGKSTSENTNDQLSHKGTTLLKMTSSSNTPAIRIGSSNQEMSSSVSISQMSTQTAAELSTSITNAPMILGSKYTLWIVPFMDWMELYIVQLL